MEIGALVLALWLLGVANIWLLWHHQKRLSFAHPGWVLVIACLFYGLPSPLMWIISPDLLFDVSPAIVGKFDYEIFVRILSLYCLCMSGFLFAQCVIVSIPSRILASNSSVRFSRPLTPFVVVVILTLLLGTGIYLFFQNYDKIGGFIAFMSMQSRSDAFHLLTQESGFTRYQLVFHSIFILGSIFVFQNRSIRGIKWLLGTFVIYAILVLIMGTRLEVIVVALGIGFVIHALCPDLVRRYRKRVLMGVILVLVLFSLYAHVRISVRYYFAHGTWMNPDLSLVDIYPVETVTGYVPGFIIEQQGYGDFLSTYPLNFVPSTVFNLIGFDKGASVSSMIANSLSGPWGRAVYTVTLPVDAYVGSNMLGVFIISGVLYMVFFLCTQWACRRGYFGIGVGALVFINMYYVVRVESVNWFGRLWQDVGVFIFVAVAYFALIRALGRRRQFCVREVNSTLCRKP